MKCCIMTSTSHRQVQTNAALANLRGSIFGVFGWVFLIGLCSTVRSCEVAINLEQNDGEH